MVCLVVRVDGRRAVGVLAEADVELHLLDFLEPVGVEELVNLGDFRRRVACLVVAGLELRRRKRRAVRVEVPPRIVAVFVVALDGGQALLVLDVRVALGRVGRLVLGMVADDEAAAAGSGSDILGKERRESDAVDGEGRRDELADGAFALDALEHFNAPRLVLSEGRSSSTISMTVFYQFDSCCKGKV